MVPEGGAVTRAGESFPAGDESNGAAPDASEYPADAAVAAEPELEETEENAQKLFDSGCDALKRGEYEAAGDDLCKALEIRTKIYGELAPECATVYHKYGCSLLYKVQAERDILSEPKEKGGADSEAPEAEAEGDGAAEGAAASEAGVEEEDIEDEEESDLELAWKMMDIARVIHDKQHTHSLEEVDVISGLADISLEKEDFNTCFDDYNKALEILTGIVESDSRRLAELYFKMALAKQLAKAPTSAIDYCQKAISVCGSRLARLKRELASEDESSRSSKEDEIKEMEALSVDLNEKIEELQQMAAAPPLLEVLKSENPEVVETVKLAFKAAADAAAASSNGGAKPEGAPSTSNEIHLGVVGRGIKRAAPIPISDNGNGKRALADEHHQASS